jgi:Heterokaryon incompatibility protein (HET)
MTPTLHSALTRLQFVSSSYLLWADALCINQYENEDSLWERTECCAQHPGIGNVIDGSTAYTLPRKPEGQPHIYNTDRLTLCLTYRLTCVSQASRMRIITEARPIRNSNEV